MSYQKHNFEAGAVLFASQLNDMDNQIEFLSNQGSSFSDDFKTALLNCFENVAWINENGQTYYDALYSSLYPDNMWFITNVLTGCITSNNATSILKNNSYVATITANQGYILDGATVNILMGGNDVTNLYYSSGSINIPNVTGDLVITVSAVSDILSISTVFSNTDIPIDISQSQIINSWLDDSTAEWKTASESSCICIPVTVGRQYSLNWSTTDSSLVGGFIKWGFSDTNTPNSQVVTHFTITSPQSVQDNTTAVADKQYLVIQIANSHASEILTNEYLTVTKLAGVITDADSLDTLRQYLTVTATLYDSSTVIVTEYTLSGTLAEGTSTITVSYGGKTDTFDVTVVHKLSLDDIAYGTLTYRDIFVTGNMVGIGNFEGTYTWDSNWHNYPDSSRVYKMKYSGNPTRSTDFYVSPTHSLKCFGTSSTQTYWGVNSQSYQSGTKFLVGANIKVDRYVSGNIGVILNSPIINYVDAARSTLNTVTSGFVPKATICTLTANRSDWCLYMGVNSSGNADCYVDAVVVAIVPSEMTDEEAQQLYEGYTARILGGAT